MGSTKKNKAVAPLSPEEENFDEIVEKSLEAPDSSTPEPEASDRLREGEDKAVIALKKLVNEDEEDEPANISLRTILGGDILGGRWFRRNFWYLVLVAVLLVFYVSNRYYCQQEMIEGTRLRDTLQDRRYKALTLSGQLKELTRRSEVEKQLADTTLKTPTTTIYSLTVEADDTAASDERAD